MVKSPITIFKQTIIPNRVLPSIRNYPGEYRLRKWQNLSDTEKRRLNLTKHETTHDIIEEVKTNRIVMLATSSKGKDAPNGPFIKIDPVKIDKSYIPKKHPITKKPLMDDYGFTIPDPEAGGQHIAVLETPRVLQKDVQHKCPVKTEDQPYVDKHESKLRDIMTKKSGLKVPKNIGGQDDE